MKNQYEVLGKAPGAEDLKKLSNENVHLTIKNPVSYTHLRANET